MTINFHRPWWDKNKMSGADYDAVFEARAAAGENVHGEADAVMRLHPHLPLRVLDAGCGTGRVALELARRGVKTVGVDLDQKLLTRAQKRSPDLVWHLADLATLDLDAQFDIIILAGNVILFLEPDTEAKVVANMARHLATDGLLVCGFQLGFNHVGLPHYDALAQAAGLTLVDRWSTWAGDPWQPSEPYAVSVHRLLDSKSKT